MCNFNNFTNSNVKFLREKNGIPQAKLAEDLSIDQSTLAKWENNTRQVTLEWCLKLAQYFNVFVGDFISKDFRLIEKNIDLPKLSEDEILRLFKQEFTKKGLLDENEEMTKDTFDNLIEFAKANKKFIIKSEEKK